MTDLTAYGCYKITTTAGRTLYLMFRGKRGSRLCFTNLDAPYQDIPLRASHIVTCEPINAQDTAGKVR